MKLRLALSALVYAAALSIAALVVTGHLSLTPFSGNTQQVMALENEDSGSSILLCYGCYQQTTASTYRVTVTVTFQPSYNTCQWGCNQYQTYQQPVYQQYNTCQWGCGGYTNSYTNWNTGCGCQRYW
jgi:hypothetical protein